MKGFFNKNEVSVLKRPKGKSYSCISCGLFKNSDNPYMKEYGEFRKKILIIGEAPSEFDDGKNRPFSDHNGKILARALREHGIDLKKDCLLTNSVHCVPRTKAGKNRKPTPFETNCCWRFNEEIIRNYKPKLIILLGYNAAYAVLGREWKKDFGSSLAKWRGWAIPEQSYKSWVLATYHPSYLAHMDKPELETIWHKDLEKAISYLDKPFPITKPAKIDIITDLSPLQNIQKGLVTFDYEATGLKPHGKGHRIVMASVADSPDHAFTFMMPKTKKGRKPFVDLLKNPAVKKMAQNMKYEEAWSVNRLKTSVEQWVFDTMVASHQLDNRPGVAGLKFQVYVNFGVGDYSSEISKYLKPKSGNDQKNANAHNQLLEFISTPEGKEDALTYCAWDSIWEYRLALLQLDTLGITI